MEIGINSERLLKNIEALAQFGRNSDGGIDRQLGSPADSEARVWLSDYWQQKLGLNVRLDAIANMWGEGNEAGDSKPIVIGSHHDSVPNGGKYDGALGVLMATEVLQTLQENQVSTKHPLKLISFTGEEPNDFSVSTLGSKVLCGRLTTPDLRKLYHRVSGETLATAIKRLGGDIERAAEARLSIGSLAAFLECHIEQGLRLIGKDLSVAAVSCITGIYREIITVSGEANHAGTTRYKQRRDALAAAAEVVLAVEAIMKNQPQAEIAATIGRITVEPNSSNIIPGKVVLTLDLRTADVNLRQQALNWLGEQIAEISQRRQVKITRQLNLDQAEMPMATEVMEAVKDGAAELGQPRLELVSMAGHDAANMARITKAGMLFVASIDGYSHCPQEACRTKDIINAANNMLQTVLLLDRRLA